jgi:hypothetical protein
MASNNDDNLAAIMQDFFKACAAILIAAYDLTNIAERLNKLDLAFGNNDKPLDPPNELAWRVHDAGSAYLVRPAASYGFPSVPDEISHPPNSTGSTNGAGQHAFLISPEQPTMIDGRLANLPATDDEGRTAMLLHGLMQCIVLATTSFGNALRDLRGIKQRMGRFAPGSSATIVGIHASYRLQPESRSGSRNCRGSVNLPAGSR